MLKGGKGYTIADIEALPAGERAELIDGELFRMDMPARIHQRFLIKLAFEIELYIRNQKGNCEVYPAPFAVYIKKDKKNYVEPDIVVICSEDRLDEKGCHGAPDWAIEIVSPSSKKMDYERKLKLYREAGVREYWIVDPETETVTVYDFGGAKEACKSEQEVGGNDAEAAYAPSRYAFTEQIKAGIFENLWLNLSQMDYR